MPMLLFIAIHGGLLIMMGQHAGAESSTFCRNPYSLPI